MNFIRRVLSSKFLLQFFLLSAVTVLCLAGLTIPAQAADVAVRLPHFKPGVYSLIRGEINLCGDGDFYLDKDGKSVTLGYYHGFEIHDDQVTLPGDAPGDSGCVYKGTSHVRVFTKKTVLTSTDDRICKGVSTYHTLEIATIHDNGYIDLSMIQAGKPDLKYNCAWTFQHPLKK